MYALIIGVPDPPKILYFGFNNSICLSSYSNIHYPVLSYDINITTSHQAPLLTREIKSSEPCIILTVNTCEELNVSAASNNGIGRSSVSSASIQPQGKDSLLHV